MSGRTSAPAAPTLSVVMLVNDEAQYNAARESLESASQPGPVDVNPVHADRHGWNAAEALNRGIESARADWIACVHQDVRFAPGWWATASRQIAAWPGLAGVVGLVGIRPSGAFAGHVLDPHGHLYWGPLPARVVTVDEHMILLRREAGLRFDPLNPGFHCYGADIALSAAAAGWDVIVIDAPVVHLSGGRLDPAFERASAWLMDKWGPRRGDVLSTCAKLLSRPRAGNALRRLWQRVNRRWSQQRADCGCELLESMRARFGPPKRRRP